jgi:hypothetical protein
MDEASDADEVTKPGVKCSEESGDVSAKKSQEKDETKESKNGGSASQMNMRGVYVND